MNPYLILGDRKLNDFSSTPTNPFVEGPDFVKGFLGARFALTEKIALKLSNTNKGTLRNGIYQIVRVRGALVDWDIGRPVFWSDTNLFEVTSVAATTALLAGICLNTPDALGDYVYIQTYGDVGGLWDGTLTKATPALNDPVILKIGSSLATLNVLADATAWTQVEKKLEVGRVNETVTAGAVKRIILTRAIQIYNEGII